MEMDTCISICVFLSPVAIMLQNKCVNCIPRNSLFTVCHRMATRRGPRSNCAVLFVHKTGRDSTSASSSNGANLVKGLLFQSFTRDIAFAKLPRKCFPRRRSPRVNRASSLATVNRTYARRNLTAVDKWSFRRSELANRIRGLEMIQTAKRFSGNFYSRKNNCFRRTLVCACCKRHVARATLARL